MRNIALAGTYGSGKSSVLRKLAENLEGRVVEVSLLTLGKDPEPVATGADSNPAAGTATNRIQKEIVKQLLYRQNPSRASESRFRRIARVRPLREIGIALLFGLLTLAVLLAVGLDTSPLERFGIIFADPPAWLSSVVPYIAVVAAVGLVVLLVRMLLQGRLAVEKVTAGPATITLPARSSTYFDEYLDEIIYFFETNKRLDIVVLEDLDRFDDPHIFESLRSLNLVLNSAHQLRRRNIRFVYAVKDSVFERLGRDAKVAASDEARAELVRANRTKFFELVVPMVPFITHKNARDLMHDQLARRGHTLSKDVVDLAARHVADMRLIHNIVNEYEVFKNRLLDVPRPVPGLTPELLFAMILFKNAHAADFEAIRLGTSSLDGLFETWRSLVSANLRRIRTEEARLLARIEDQEAADERAAELGGMLLDRLGALASAPNSALSTILQKRFAGSVVEDADLRSAPFWRGIIESNGSLVLTHRDQWGSPREMTLAVPVIETLLGTKLDVDTWAARSATGDRATIARNHVDAAFLRHHEWRDLVERPQFTYSAGDGGGSGGDRPQGARVDGDPAKTFLQWVEHLLPSPLAVDLVVNGWITSYFSLYVSAFYGQLIRRDAMTYVMRNVDRGTADPDYPLNADDVESILRDLGNSVLTDRSMYNVSILNHLLTKRPEQAAVVVGRLAAAGQEELAFIGTYLSAGSAQKVLVAQLAERYAAVFPYIVGTAPVERAEKARLLDVAIAHRSDEVNYELTDELRDFIEASYGSMPSLTDAGLAQRAADTVDLIAGLGAVLADVTGLSEAACDALARTRAYRLTGPNLERLSGTDNISLDRLAQAPDEIYQYAVDNLRKYARAHGESPSTAHTIADPNMFSEVLNASKTWDETDYEWLVEGTAPGSMVEDLTDVPERAWPALVVGERAPATFANVSSYVEVYDEVDDHLGALLLTVKEIAEVNADQDARTALATAIVNAGAVLPDPAHRIKLAISMRPGTLPAASIDPEAGELIGRLINAKLIEDDEAAFDARLMVDWPTREYAIVHSDAYADIVDPNTLSLAHIAPLLRSDQINTAVQTKVVTLLPQFDGVPAAAYQAAADCALRSRVTLTVTGIKMVRDGGASTKSVVDLLVKAGEEVPDDEFCSILGALGDPYVAIAKRGTQRPRLDDTSANHAILERLKRIGVVSSFSLGRDSRLRVNLKQA